MVVPARKMRRNLAELNQLSRVHPHTGQGRLERQMRGTEQLARALAYASALAALIVIGYSAGQHLQFW